MSRRSPPRSRRMVGGTSRTPTGRRGSVWGVGMGLTPLGATGVFDGARGGRVAARGGPITARPRGRGAARAGPPPPEHRSLAWARMPRRGRRPHARRSPLGTPSADGRLAVRVGRTCTKARAGAAGATGDPPCGSPVPASGRASDPRVVDAMPHVGLALPRRSPQAALTRPHRFGFSPDTNSRKSARCGPDTSARTVPKVSAKRSALAAATRSSVGNRKRTVSSRPPVALALV